MDWATFETEVEAAIAELPADFRSAIDNVAILLEDEADPATQREMDLAHPWDLLGLYRGVPWPDRGASYAGAEPDQVLLYRNAIVDYAGHHRLAVSDCVRNVLIHELGHYMGFDDDQLEGIEHGDDGA